MSSTAALPTPGPGGGGSFSSVEGKALYQAQCASCHDTGAAKSIENRSVLQIQGAIASVSAMKNLNLSMAQLHSLEIYLDRIAPAVAIVSPINGSTLAALAGVSGTCEAGLEVEVIVGASAAVLVPCANGSFNHPVAGSPLAGSVNVQVKQSDLNANTKSAMVRVTIDNVAPIVAFTAPASGATLTSPALTVSGTCDLVGQPLTISGSALAASVGTTCSSAGQFSSPVTVAAINGAKTIMIEQTDAAGNRGAISRSVNVAISTAGPSIAITQPAANLNTRVGITLSGTCSSGLNVAISGTGVQSATNVACTGGTFTAPIAFSAGNGQKNVIVSQTNAQGLMGQDARNFIFDNTPPAITISSPAANTSAASGLSIAGTCENGLPVQLSGTGISASQTLNCVNSQYQVNVTFSAGLGTKAISLSQTDLAGNAGTISRNFMRVDPTANLYQNDAFGKQGLRRLTRYELGNSLTLALTLDPGAKLDLIPDDLGVTIYFDNEQGPQPIAANVIAAYQTFAKSYAADVVASAARIQQLAGCAPSGPADRNCFVSFAQKVGRRLFRRPVTTAEATRYADVVLPFATTDNRFATAIELFLRAALQHPEFLYRIESGSLSNGLLSLNDFQVATRISFFIWGSGPDDALLDAAQSSQLRVDANRVSQGQRLLADNRARRHFARFHAEWLGFSRLKLHPSLDSDMRTETNKLVERVAFDLNQDWMEIFKSNETFVTPALAAHYGLPAMASAGWVNHMGQRGGGVLSHASMARLGAKFADTSPTLRGYEIFKRVLCGKLPGAIPAGVDTDIAPGSPTQCKTQNYSMRTMASCQGCHTVTDNIGFGMENVSAFGQWRNVEPGLPQCTITGQGSVTGVAFTGPRGLGDVLALDSRLQACATRQLFRFMSGREETSSDAGTLDALSAQCEQSRTLSSLVLSLVKTPAIMYKGAL